MLKLLKKHFNSTTLRGRANTAKLTYATFALIYLYHRYGKKKPPPTAAEMDAMREERGSCATFPSGNTDGDGDGDTKKEERRGSCSNKDGPCPNGDVKKKEETGTVEEFKSAVNSEAENAKKALYGPDKVTVSGPTKVVTSYGSAGKPAIKVDEIGKVATDNELSAESEKSKAAVDAAKETSKSDTANGEEAVAGNVESTLALDKIEKGTLLNASLNAEVDTAKGTIEKIGEAVLQNF